MSREEDTWPLPAEVPQWWRDWAELTDEQKWAMADAYQREAIATAQSEQQEIPRG